MSRMPTGRADPAVAARRAQAGFTLLELLIAIALLGLLTSLAYGGVQFGLTTWRRAEHRRVEDTDRAAVERILRQAIGGAYPEFTSPNLIDRTVLFDGEQNNLLLVAPLPAAIEAGIMARQHFFLRTTDDGPTLTMGWRLDLPAADGGVLPENIVPLVAHTSTIQFSYFGRRPHETSAAWFDAWRGLDTLPQLVRVRLWRSDHGTAWLDVIVATKTTTSTACVYDPSDFNCRRIR